MRATDPGEHGGVVDCGASAGRRAADLKHRGDIQLQLTSTDDKLESYERRPPPPHHDRRRPRHPASASPASSPSLTDSTPSRTVTRSMPRWFKIAGPCRPALHYTLPDTRRLPRVRRLVEHQSYFVLHAPRQLPLLTRELGRIKQHPIESSPGSSARTTQSVQCRFPRASKSGDRSAISRGTARITRALGISSRIP